MSLLRHPGFILVLFVLILLLFGSSKLPDLARGLGQSMKILRKDVKDMRDDDKKTPASEMPAAQQAREAAHANEESQQAAPEQTQTGSPTEPRAPGVAVAGSPGQSAPMPAPEPQAQPTPTTPDASDETRS